MRKQYWTRPTRRESRGWTKPPQPESRSSAGNRRSEVVIADFLIVDWKTRTPIAKGFQSTIIDQKSTIVLEQRCHAERSRIIPASPRSSQSPSRYRQSPCYFSHAHCALYSRTPRTPLL